jgi:hypothetical protein
MFPDSIFTNLYFPGRFFFISRTHSSECQCCCLKNCCSQTFKIYLLYFPGTFFYFENTLLWVSVLLPHKLLLTNLEDLSAVFSREVFFNFENTLLWVSVLLPYSKFTNMQVFFCYICPWGLSPVHVSIAVACMVHISGAWSSLTKKVTLKAGLRLCSR